MLSYGTGNNEKLVSCSLCSVFAVMHFEDQMRDVR